MHFLAFQVVWSWKVSKHWKSFPLVKISWTRKGLGMIPAQREIANSCLTYCSHSPSIHGIHKVSHGLEMNQVWSLETISLPTLRPWFNAMFLIIACWEEAAKCACWKHRLAALPLESWFCRCGETRRLLIITQVREILHSLTLNLGWILKSLGILTLLVGCVAWASGILEISRWL